MPHADRSPPEVIELLETYLDFARKNPLGVVAIAMVGFGKPKDVCVIHYAGEVQLEESLIDSMDLLKAKVQKSIASWTLPPEDDKLDPSYVCYNVANGPLGFDFITWLVAMEMRRVRLGAPAPLKVGFWEGKDQNHMNKNARLMWLNNVFRPALDLIGAVEKPIAVHGYRTGKSFVPKEIVQAARAGEAVPQFRTVIPIDPRSVTITLRESDLWPHRNSNLREWRSVANHLQQLGERVIFIRDAAKAHMPLMDGKFETAPRASRDLQYRMALYQEAKMNFFVANGPQTLALYSDRPWCMFIPIEPDDSHYNVNKRDYWREHFDIEAGSGQYPWSTPDQRIIWKPDTYENIMEAWEEFQQAKVLAAE